MDCGTLKNPQKWPKNEEQNNEKPYSNYIQPFSVWTDKGCGHLQLHFQKCSFWKCKSQKCKNKNFSQKSKKSFERRFENDTFESAFFKSVEIVSAYSLNGTTSKSVSKLM